MSATINPRQSTSSSSIGQDAKPSNFQFFFLRNFGILALLDKIDGHLVRVNDVILLEKEDGFWSVSFSFVLSRNTKFTGK